MYLNYWKLKRLPFDNVPDPDFFFMSATHEQALTRLMYAAETMKGCAVLSGNVGSGKTILIHVFMEQMPRERFDIGLISNPCPKPNEFLQDVLYKLAITDVPRNRVDGLHALNQRLTENEGKNKGTILIVDETQLLTEAALEEIRLLLNFQSTSRFLLTIFLVGQPEIMTNIKGIQQLDQRVSLKYMLTPFCLEETAQYILFRQNKAGAERNIFSRQAIETIFDHTKGIPRSINNLCDTALFMACTKKQDLITSELIADIAGIAPCSHMAIETMVASHRPPTLDWPTRTETSSAPAKEVQKESPHAEIALCQDELLNGFNSPITTMARTDSFASTAGQSSEKAGSVYAALLEQAEEVKAAVQKNHKISPSPVLALLHDIIGRNLINDLYEYAVLTSKSGELPSHSVSVMAASLRVGCGLGYDTKKLLQLGLAAFLENVGMYKIPQHILTKEGKLSPEEKAEILKHTEISAQILGQLGPSFHWLVDVAAQVHERADGSGYPKGLKGKEITEYASVIGLMDTYVAMIKKRPYRDKHMESDTARFIIGRAKEQFAPEVVRGFLDQISLFPVNTRIRLNDGSIGRVLSTDGTKPLRPKIEILLDRAGQKPLTSQVIDLSAFPLLRIESAIDDSPIDEEQK